MRNNILFITLSDQTGADTPLIKVAAALHRQGHKVQVLVKEKSQNNDLVTCLPARKGHVAELGFVVHEDRGKTVLKRDLKYLFNSVNEDNSYQDTAVIIQHLRFNPQVIFVGVSYDFLTSTDILHLSEATQAVVYNVAVDMNHFTGGCHFAWDCAGYLQGCNTVSCPAIMDDGFQNLASRNFLIKKENAARGNFRILAGTMWTKLQAQASSIYKGQQQIFNISGVVDTGIFNPGKRQLVREAVFDLCRDKFYILAGSENTQDVRKGYDYFVNAVNLFWDKLLPLQRDQVEVLSVTRILDEEAQRRIRFGKRNIAYIKDDQRLSALYQAADVYVNCSLEDSGPAMLLEAMACGTPVVSFDMGAAPEFVADGVTGYIVQNKDSEALAEALLRVFNMSPEERRHMGAAGHKQVADKGSLTGAVTTMEQILAYHRDDFARYSKSVSVALCTCNGEKYIAEQLDSILYQNQQPDEIIICDDCSTDATLSIVESYQKAFPETIKLYRNKERLGVVKNFEKAINLCTKEIIFLSDQDDVWLPHKTEAAIRIFNRFPGIEAISHNLKVCKENKELLDISMWDTMGFQYFLNGNFHNKNYLFHTILFGNMVTGAAFCMKRPVGPVILHNHVPDVIHDYQLAIDYLTKRSLYFHNECLGLYRQHENQQLGADLHNTVYSAEHIRLYYEVGNPFRNLLFMKERMQNQNVFYYLESIENTGIEKAIRENVKAMAYSSLKPKFWRVQVKLMSEKLEKVRVDTDKRGISALLELYVRFLRNLSKHLFFLGKIYFIIVYSSFLHKKLSIFRFIANPAVLQKKKYF